MNQNLEITNLESSATMRDIEHLCDVAIQNHYGAVCIPPYYVPLASTLLKGKPIEIATIIGNQNGSQTTNVKSYEAIEAIQNGATEIGMYLNLSALKNEDWDYIKEEIEEVRDSIDGKTLKLIVDPTKLTDEELIKIIRICNEAFINYIETTNLDKIDTILKHKSELLEIKINSDTDFLSILEKGISRIGITKENNKRGETK